MLRERARSFLWRSAKAGNRTNEKNLRPSTFRFSATRGRLRLCRAVVFCGYPLIGPMVDSSGICPMEGRTETQRRRPADNYWLNVVQIPMLRALGLAALFCYLLIFHFLIDAPFFFAGFFSL